MRRNPLGARPIAGLTELQAERFRRPYVSGADVLLVFDTESFYYTAANAKLDPVSTEVIERTTADLYHSGVAFDMVYLFDLERLDLRPYKAVIFTNTFCVDSHQRDLVHTRVAQAGRHLFWSCAPGFIDGDSASEQGISHLTGIAVSRVPAGPARVVVEHAGVPTCTFGFKQPIEPLFAVRDETVTAFGKLVGSEHVGLARKRLANHTAWFCSVPLREPGLLRALLREAGAHIYSVDGDVIYAGSGLLTVHSATGGQRVLTLRNGRKVEVKLPAPCTAVFDAESGEQLR